MRDTKHKAFLVEKDEIQIDTHQLKLIFIAILVILIITYSVGEIVVRIFEPQELYSKQDSIVSTHPKEVEYDRDLGWSTVKNYKEQRYDSKGPSPDITISHNSQGFRMDHEIDESKNILIMTGDSLTYGFSVDDKKIVSAKLNELLGEDWEVINLAVGGYGTDQSMLRFMRDGIKYKPKVVVHTLFNNDFSNILASYQYDVFKPVFIIKENEVLELTNVPVPLSKNYELSYPKERKGKYGGLQGFMGSWSHLYLFYKSRGGSIKSIMKNFFNLFSKEEYISSYKDGEFWAIEKDYSHQMNFAFYLNSIILKKYDKLARQNDSDFIFVVIGDKISVDTKMQKATIEKYKDIDDGFFDYEKPYRLLEEFTDSEDIKMVNLFPLFKQEFQEGRSVYLEGDHHLNDYGHELFAKEIYTLLVEDGLIEIG